jgi:hypothetical protein
MRICESLGGSDPRVYLHVIRLVFVAMSMGVALGIVRLARVVGASALAAAAGGAAWALSAPAIYFAHRAMSENAAALTGVWAVALLLTPGASARVLWFGGSLLGLSVLLRLQMGLLAMAMLGLLASRQDWSAVKHVAAALFLWALAYGALDAATWNDAPDVRYGGWFHSAVTYWQVNVVHDGASAFGVSPATYYPQHIFTSMPFLSAGIAAGLVAGLRSAPDVTILTLLFVAVHSAVPHKELRFILPALPLAIAAAVVAFDRFPRRLRLASVGYLAVAAVISVSTFPSLTWGDLGAFPERSKASAWDHNGSVNRLLLAAHGAHPRVCGIRVNLPTVWHGGSSFLHRRVHFYGVGTDASLRLYNYAITLAGSGLPVVARDGEWELVRMPEVKRPCAREPDYDWQLYGKPGT